MEKRLKKLRIMKEDEEANYWNPLTYIFLLVASIFVIITVTWHHFYPKQNKTL